MSDAIRDKIEATLAPAIDCRAPYAKVMITKIIEIAADEAKPHIAEIDRLQAWVGDLQCGMYVNCIYCGYRHGLAETTPASMADSLKAHIAQCEHHPMAKALQAIWQALDDMAGSHCVCEETKQQLLAAYADGTGAPFKFGAP
jgi:Zn ribbon nucleic-acid-binding protein